MPAVSFNSPAAVAGIVGLGYPLYFVTLLTIAKILGSLVLIIPQIPARVKEWAYAGFGIDFISAFISMWVVVGLVPLLILPVVAFGILTVSYVYYHKMTGAQA